jgi:hypothetical protein
MSEIKRYDILNSDVIGEDKNGNYVLFSEYEKLEKQLHDLEDAIADLADKNWGEPNRFLTSESDGNDAIIYQAIKNSEARQ